MRIYKKALEAIANDLLTQNAEAKALRSGEVGTQNFKLITEPAFLPNTCYSIVADFKTNIYYET